MLPLTERAVRSSIVNASQRERSEIVFPAGFDELDWESLDYLGWRDPKRPLQGVVVAEVDGEAVGVLLRQADGSTRSRPQCSWCEDVHLPNDVVFYVARRAGKAGRAGGTVGTLACAGFECSANVRRPQPPAYVGFDVDAERARRIEALRANVTGFLRTVRG